MIAYNLVIQINRQKVQELEGLFAVAGQILRYWSSTRCLIRVQEAEKAVADGAPRSSVIWRRISNGILLRTDDSNATGEVVFGYNP